MHANATDMLLAPLGAAHSRAGFWCKSKSGEISDGQHRSLLRIINLVLYAFCFCCSEGIKLFSGYLAHVVSDQHVSILLVECPMLRCSLYHDTEKGFFDFAAISHSLWPISERTNDGHGGQSQGSHDTP